MAELLKIYILTVVIKKHPCDTNKGGCAEICIRDGDKAKCAYKKGWGLQPDGKKCKKTEPET